MSTDTVTTGTPRPSIRELAIRGNHLIFRSSGEIIGIFILLIILMGVYEIYDPTFISGSSVVILSAQFLPLIIAAMAQAVVMLTGGIDLSIGAVLSLVMATFALLADTPMGVVPALVIALAVGVGVGLINGILVTYARLPSIIVTLAASFLWTGVTLVILPQPGGKVPAALVRAYNLGWNGLAIGVVVLVLVLLLWKYIARSRFGLSLYAVGGNPHGAFASGIRVDRVRVMAYGLSGLFIGFAGVALTMQTGTGDATIGTPYTLNTIAAAILGGVTFQGGVGTMRGVVMGALVVGILPILLLFVGVSPFYQLVIQGGILIAAFAAKFFITRRKQAI